MAFLFAVLLATLWLTRPIQVPAAVGTPSPWNGLIAFQPDEHHVHYLDPATGTRSLWLRSDKSPMRLAWSPDGTRLAFTEDQPSGSRISIACAPGHEACGVPPEERFVNLRLLRWSPDGSTPLVVSEVGLRNAVTLVPTDASDGGASAKLVRQGTVRVGRPHI